MKPRLTLAAAAATSVGCVRHNNEDRHLIDAARGWFAVADGVGGLPYGERASECAIRCLVQELSRDPEASILPLDRIAEACHQAVRQLGSMLSPRTGIGTTLTFLRITSDEAELAHIGDSIGYLHPARAKSIRRLTTDHTVPVPGVVIAGHVSENFVPPPRLDRYLGQSASPECDLMCFPLVSGDRLILCSDGLTRALDETDLADLSRAQSSPSALAQALVRVADIRGGIDNSTVIIIDAL